MERLVTFDGLCSVSTRVSDADPHPFSSQLLKVPTVSETDVK